MEFFSWLGQYHSRLLAGNGGGDVRFRLRLPILKFSHSLTLTTVGGAT